MLHPLARKSDALEKNRGENPFTLDNLTDSNDPTKKIVEDLG
jgi:hypothetical protein